MTGVQTCALPIYDQAWLASATPSASGTVALAPGATQVVEGTFHVNALCQPAVSDPVHFLVDDVNIPGRRRECGTTLTCNLVTAVGSPSRASLGLTNPRPNPASGEVRFGFELSRPGGSLPGHPMKLKSLTEE